MDVYEEHRCLHSLELLQFELTHPPSPESGKLWLLPLLFPCQACPQFNLWKGAFLSSWAGGSVAQKISPLLTLLLEGYSFGQRSLNSFMGCLGVSAFQLGVCTFLLAFHVSQQKTLTSCIAVDGLAGGGKLLCHCAKKANKTHKTNLWNPLPPHFQLKIYTCENEDWWMDQQALIGQLLKGIFQFHSHQPLTFEIIIKSLQKTFISSGGCFGFSPNC